MGKGEDGLVDEEGIGDEEAVVGGTEGAVDLGGTGGVEDATGIGGSDASAGHDDDATIGLKDELAKQGNVGFGGEGLSGGEEARAAQVDDVLEGLEGVAGTVEGAVEGGLHALGGFDEAATKRDIDVTIAGQCADDYTIGSQLMSETDVEEHRVGFGIVIDKIAFARANEDMELQTLNAASGFDCFGRGGEAVEMEGRAEFDTRGTALNGSLGAGEVACAYFEGWHGGVLRPNTAATETKGR